MSKNYDYTPSNRYGEKVRTFDSLETDNWDGRKPSSMSNSHLIRTVLYLERNAKKLKKMADMDVLDSDASEVDNIVKALSGKENAGEPPELVRKFWEIEPGFWVRSSKIYKLLVAEIKERGLTYFLDIHRSYEDEATQSDTESASY